MTTTYGVNPQGFIVKPYAQILRDIENANLATFGPNLIQTVQTPLGQINGMAADLAYELWEVAQDVYHSLDPDQAEGARLDSTAKLRLIERLLGEDDIALRAAITNAQQARFDVQDVQRAVEAVTGVTWAKVWVNETDSVDANGMPAGSVCVAALGGNDEDVAAAARGFLAPGVIQFGNTTVDVTIDDYCRSIIIMRPTEVDATIDILVTTQPDANGCPPPSLSSISAGLLAALNSPRLNNGVDLTEHFVSTAIAQLYGRTVDVTESSNPGSLVSVAFDEIVNLTAVNVTVS